MAKKKAAKKKATKKAAKRSKVPQLKKAKITRHLTHGQVSEITDKLTSLRNSCLEAIDGTWDKSREGFEAMEGVCYMIADILKIKLPGYSGPDPSEFEDEEDESKFAGKVEVLLHTVNFRFWGIDAPLTDELKQRLTKEAEERATTMIADGYREGELNHYYTWDGDRMLHEQEIRGWWEIDWGKADEDDLSTPYHCQDCGHKAPEEEFVPSDGNPAPHVCPECGKTNCFAD